MHDTIKAYDATATAYADRWFGFRLQEDMARLVGRLGPNARVLDVGCGPGRDVAWLAEQGFDVVGVDLAFRMLEEGLARGVSAPLIQADMGRLPFRRGSFQGLWVCASLLNISKDQAGEVLKELARVVHPGHIYVSVKRGEGEEWVSDDQGHRCLFAYYHPAEIQLLMERSGFEVLSCWESKDAAGRHRSWIGILAWTKMETPKVGANAIILNEAGEVLLTRRADNGLWCLPGGHMDYGETIRQCTVREAYEETGLLVEAERLVGVYSRPNPKGNGVPNPKHYVILAFVCRPVGGELRLCEETTAIRYFAPSALPEGLWPWHRQRILDTLADHTNPVIC